MSSKDKGRAKVYLVGAGPGDPELLTLKALRVLREADVVLHDGLVSQEILALLPPQTRIINGGKRCRQKLFTQEQISSLLVELAASGRTVVRLKCGDSMIFGRANEEIEALRNAGIDCEVVPGITAASAAAAAAQISLTDRRSASQVVFVTAHQAPGKAAPDFRQMAASNSTIVVYMPGDRYAYIGSRLIAAGLEPETPCAIASAVSTRQQTLLYARLRDLATLGAVPAPAVLIVGRAVQSGEEQISGLVNSLGAVNLLPDPAIIVDSP
jgi:uroporphyrin-III C-methyltransferase